MTPIDTNVIIRFLTGDRPADHSPRAYEVFRQLAAGTTAVLLTEAVLVETEQVLTSAKLYKLPRDEVRRHLSNVIGLKGVRLAHKRRYLRALELYVEIPRLDFVDAILAAYAEELSPPAVLSFDQDFDRVPGISRIEP